MTRLALPLLALVACTANALPPVTTPPPPAVVDAGPGADAAPPGDAGATLPPLEGQAPAASQKGLYQLVRARGDVRGKHPAPLRDLVWSGPDVLDASSGLASFRWPEGAPLRAAAGLDVKAMARSADGQRLALVASDGSVLVAAEPGAVLWRGSPALGATAAVFADRDTLFLATQDGRLRRVRLAGSPAQEMAPTSGARQLDIAASPDGKLVAVAAADAQVRLYDARTLALLRELGGHHDQVSSVAFFPDGHSLASASWDATALVHDLDDAGAAPRPLTGHLARVRDVAVSPDGTRVATVGGDGHLRLFDAQSGALVSDWLAHATGASCVAFSPDGTRLASGGDDLAVRAWTLDGKPTLDLAPQAGRVEAVAASEDGHRIAWLADLGMLFWSDDGGAARSLRAHPVVATGLALDRSGALALTGGHDKTVIAWTLPAGTRGKSWLAGRWVNGIEIMPDGRVLLATSRWSAFIWDLATGKASGLGAHKQRVNAVGLSRDGKLAISCASDRTARVWTVEDGKQKAIAQETSKVWACLITPDGKLFVDGADDGHVRSYTLPDKGEAKTIDVAAHGKAVRALALSPDGSRLVSLGDDGMVIVLDLRKLSELDRLDLTPWSELAVSLAFTPGGHLLLGTARGQLLDYQPAAEPH